MLDKVLAINNINFLFVIIGFILTTLSLLSSYNYINTNKKWYYLIHITYIIGFSLVILTQKWIILLVGWEIVTLATALMLIWSSNRLAWQYFMIQFFGSSILLYAVLTAISLGYPQISPIQETWLQNLLIIGLGMKNAIFGFHFWLPPVHTRAPFPVSAILSGWVVKLGFIVYLKIIPDGNNLLLWLGILMIFFGGIKALLATDYKVLLAYSTISQLGYIAVGIGIGSVYSIAGSIIHIIAHGFAKTGLFIGSGYITKEYGTRSIYKIKDAWKKLSFTSITILFSFASLMGLPLLAGYNSKYLIKLGVKEIPFFTIILYGASLLTVFYSIRTLWLVILKDIIKQVNFNLISKNFKFHNSEVETHKWLSLLPVILILPVLGIFPSLIVQFEEFHLLNGIRNNIIYILLVILILQKFDWFKIEEKEAPSLDRIFKNIYELCQSLSTKSIQYNTESFFENHLYRLIYKGARLLHNIIYSDFQSQLLWIPIVLFVLLLWITIV